LLDNFKIIAKRKLFIAILRNAMYICVTLSKTKIKQIMRRQVLQIGYKDKILSDEVLRGKIASVTERSSESVKRWVKEDNIILTTKASLDAIRQHLGLPEIEILTTEDDVLI